jgi:hypothetical protein
MDLLGYGAERGLAEVSGGRSLLVLAVLRSKTFSSPPSPLPRIILSSFQPEKWKALAA